MQTWWLVGVLVVGSSVARADDKGLSNRMIRQPPAQTHAAMFKLGKTWTFPAKHTFFSDGDLRTWTSTVACKVTESATIGTAQRSVIACTSAVRRKKPTALRTLTLVATDDAIWLVPETTTTGAQIKALDPSRAWIANAPTDERSWTEEVQVSVVGGGGKTEPQTRSSWALAWQGATCLLVREPGAEKQENVVCAAPGKGLVGARQLNWRDGHAFGTVPTEAQAERWK